MFSAINTELTLNPPPFRVGWAPASPPTAGTPGSERLDFLAVVFSSLPNSSLRSIAEAVRKHPGSGRQRPYARHRERIAEVKAKAGNVEEQPEPPGSSPRLP